MSSYCYPNTSKLPQEKLFNKDICKDFFIISNQEIQFQGNGYKYYLQLLNHVQRCSFILLTYFYYCSLWSRANSQAVHPELAISNLEMILNTQKGVSRLYANTMPFYRKDLSVLRFWYLWGSWYNPPWISRDNSIHKEKS